MANSGSSTELISSMLLRFLSSLAVLIFARMLIPLAPMILEWDWAYDTTDVTNVTLADNTSMAIPQISFKLAVIFIAYPVFELFTSPIAGKFGDIFGYDVAILIGLTTSLALNLLLIFTNSFVAVLLARCLQGLSIAFLLSIAMARIFEVFPTDHKYNKIAIALAMSTQAFSVLESTFAGILIERLDSYSWFLVMVPFNGLLIVIVILQSLGKKPSVPDDSVNGKSADASLRDILSDYRVLIAAGGLTVAFLNRVVLEPLIGLWIETSFNAGPEMTGLIWGVGGWVLIPANIIGARFAHWKSDWIWLYALVHLEACVFPIVYLPYSSSPYLAALAVMIYLYCASSARYAITMIFAVIAERKYHHAYGLVMAVASCGSLLPYLIGPLGAVPLVNHIGFKYTCFCIGACYLLYPAVMVSLRNVRFSETDEETEAILSNKETSD